MKQMKTDKPDWKAKLRAVVARGELIVGAGAGTGLSAKCAEEGGADLIIIYNSGRFRMAGRGSLAGLMPYGDANAIVVDMARDSGRKIALLVRSMLRNTETADSLRQLGVCGSTEDRQISVHHREPSPKGVRLERQLRQRGRLHAGSIRSQPHAFAYLPASFGFTRG